MNKIKKLCKFCGKEIIGGDNRKKFCNNSCAASYNNKKRGNHSEETKNKIASLAYIQEELEKGEK